MVRLGVDGDYLLCLVVGNDGVLSDALHSIRGRGLFVLSDGAYTVFHHIAYYLRVPVMFWCRCRNANEGSQGLRPLCTWWFRVIRYEGETTWCSLPWCLYRVDKQ